MLSFKKLAQNITMGLFLMVCSAAYADGSDVVMTSNIPQPADISASTTCCPSPCCDSESVFSAEVFFFKPSMDQSAFVISSENNFVGEERFPSGERHINSPRYKAGFRLEWLKHWCDRCYAWNVRFAYFNGGHSKSVSGPFLYDTIGFPGDGAQSPEDTFYNGTARLHDNFRYYAVDATLNRTCSCCCNDTLSFLIGLHYASIKHKRHHDSFGFFLDGTVPAPVDNELSHGSHFWGIGPEVGLDYRYNFTPQCCSSGQLYFAGSARAMLLCTSIDADFHYNTLRTFGSRGVNLRNSNLWRVNPAFDASLGLSYEFCICNTTASLDFGYEWLWYHDAIDSITGYDVAFAGDSIDLFSNFSLQGPYIRLNVQY